MTMTGDWALAEADGSSSTVANSEDTTHSPKPAAVRFPCIEQPTRVTLHCNGYYLWGCRNGKLIARKKRSEKDEWRIENSHCVVADNDKDYTDDADVDVGNAKNNLVVNICNHKYGGRLSLVHLEPGKNGSDGSTKTVLCVKERTGDVDQNDLGLEEEIDFRDPSEIPEKFPDDEDEGEEEAGAPSGSALIDALNQENQQWSLVRCGDSGVLIQSLKTGDRLGITDDGRITVVEASSSSGAGGAPGPVWDMECVTGELCFLSNPTLDVRMRCDMTGLLTLSANWKGWEVVRIMDSSGDGYVKISSWMHSQWLLCSDGEGNVSTCSHAESLLTCEGAGTEKPYRCAKWAIEKYEGVGGYPGVVIRSKTHNRLLSIRNGILRTYDSLEDISKQAEALLEESDQFCDDDNEDNTATTTTNNNNEDSAAVDGDDADAADAANPSTNQGEHLAEVVKRQSETMKRRSSDWWKNSVKNVQKKMSDSAIQRRNSKHPVDFLTRSGREEKQAIAASIAAVPEAETIVWQLEAAHLQTYYFLSDPPLDDTQRATKPRSIGAFPNVTENLRSSEKIQLVRNNDEIDTVKLYLTEKKLSMTCSSKGSIFLTNNEDDEGTEWIMEQQTDGATVFRSKPHGLYLSYKDVVRGPTTSAGQQGTPSAEAPATPAENGEEPAAPTVDEGGAPDREGDANEDETTPGNGASAANPNSPPAKKGSSGKFKIPFENLLPNGKKVTTELFGSENHDPSVLWKLEPCTPRAVSSEKIKTFAIGTSIAVGTTIAMPFALAGVAAVMGAVGAEAGISFGIVAAGLTGAEAIASVGAIGATAYICFRPQKNSLTDEHNPKGGNAGKPWSKRPFSNWRNW